MLLTRGVWRQVPEIERQVLTTAIITVASQTGTRGANALFAYNAPRITSLFYSNGPTTGGTIITLFGEQFGLEEDALSSRLGPTTTNTTQWVADSIISVTTAEGVGVVDSFALDIIGIEIEFVNPSGDATDPAFAHNAPAVSYVTHNGPVGGGTRMSIQGANFGTAPWAGTWTAASATATLTSPTPRSACQATRSTSAQDAPRASPLSGPPTPPSSPRCPAGCRRRKTSPST